jgi:hypothetical protein
MNWIYRFKGASVKRDNKQYRDLVNKAKLILSGMEDSKMKIADLAIQACTIKVGGPTSGRYTVVDFATDIDIKRRTLLGWVHARKVQKTLASKGITVTDETQLNKIRTTLREGTGRGNLGKYENAELVVKASKAVAKRSSEDDYLVLAVKKLQHVDFQISTYVLPKVDQASLADIHIMAKKIVTRLNKHFKEKL